MTQMCKLGLPHQSPNIIKACVSPYVLCIIMYIIMYMYYVIFCRVCAEPPVQLVSGLNGDNVHSQLTGSKGRSW